LLSALSLLPAPCFSYLYYSSKQIDMEFLTTLWLPILLSAVFVFIVSSLLHMVLGYHAGDFQKLSNEDQVMDTLRGLNIPTGHYAMPKADSMKDFSSETHKAKMKKGPVMMMNVRSSEMSMGSSLVKWFLYSIVVGFFCAYLGSISVPADADYLKVFQIIGCAAFMGYGLALFQEAIWGGRSWRSTWLGAFDALLYACVTAGTFGWLWHSCH
jgi:hypothetical protein